MTKAQTKSYALLQLNVKSKILEKYPCVAQMSSCTIDTHDIYFYLFQKSFGKYACTMGN